MCVVPTIWEADTEEFLEPSGSKPIGKIARQHRLKEAVDKWKVP